MLKASRSPRADRAVSARSNSVRLYMFASEAAGLSAFCADADGSKLPGQFAPWTPTGFVESGAHPPHNFSRFKIEAALKLVGFQLWRAKEKPE